MDYFERINRAIKFIEKNLKEKIRLDDIANEACFSKFHFHRIFRAMAGETAGDYIRRRRLTNASLDLIYTKESILSIAIDYKFESQASFTRAFKDMYGITPRKYRANNINCSVYGKNELTEISLKHLQGGVSMQPEIVERKEFKAIGMRGKTSLNNNTVPALWMEFVPRMYKVPNRINGKEAFGVCEYIPDFDPKEFNDDTEFTEFVCVEVDNFSEIPEGMFNKTIPGGKFAKFTHKGRVDTMKSTYDYIYGTWFPSSKYEVRNADDYELYDERFLGIDNEKSEVDIYIPIT